MYKRITNILIKNHSQKMLKIESSNSKSIQFFFQVENKLLLYNDTPKALVDMYMRATTAKIQMSLSKGHLGFLFVVVGVVVVLVWLLL